MNKMRWGMMRPPGFPFVPFLFPIGMVLSLLGLMVWLQYRSYRELRTIEQRVAPPGSPPPM